VRPPGPGGRAPAAHRLGRLGHLAAVAGTYGVWGSVGIFVRHLDLSATAISGWRLALAAIATWVAGRARPGTLVRVERRHVGDLVLLGVSVGLSWPLFILALQRTDVGVAAVLSFAWPLWYVAIDRAWSGRRYPASVVIAFVVCVAGLALVVLRSGSLPSGDDAIGVAAALGASIGAAFQLLYVRRIAADVPTRTVNLWRTVVAAVMLAPFTVRGTVAHPPGGLDLGILVLLGAVMTGVLGEVQVAGSRYLAAQETAVVSYMEPLVAAVLGALFLAERLGALGVVGVVLLLGAGASILLQGAPPDVPSRSADHLSPPASRRRRGRTPP
jgi:DME family drug/metabolite transporter